MAKINFDKIKQVQKSGSVHEITTATYHFFETYDGKYFQLDTYGTPNREVPNQPSQKIQFNKKTAEMLIGILCKGFDIKMDSQEFIPSQSIKNLGNSKLIDKAKIINIKDINISLHKKENENIHEREILIDHRDGKKYKTVKIGNKIWMAENFNYKINGSRCYDNNPANAEKYGRLYDWETAMKVCPVGWHLPSDEEWQALVDFAGGDENAGKNLKASSGWRNNGGGTDTYGFAALPGGYYNGSFYTIGYNGNWWSADNSSSSKAYGRNLRCDSKYAYWVYLDKFCGLSVRYVKN